MDIKNFENKVQSLACELAGRVVDDHFKGDDFLIYGAKNEDSDCLYYTDEAQDLFNKYYGEFETIIKKELK